MLNPITNTINYYTSMVVSYYEDINLLLMNGKIDYHDSIYLCVLFNKIEQIKNKINSFSDSDKLSIYESQFSTVQSLYNDFLTKIYEDGGRMYIDNPTDITEDSIYSGFKPSFYRVFEKLELFTGEIRPR